MPSTTRDCPWCDLPENIHTEAQLEIGLRILDILGPALAANPARAKAWKDAIGV